MDPFLGLIMIFAGNFPPRSWAFCNGQLLAISQNSALFSILGTTYGGDGRTTFALPDLRGRAALGPGTGPGLSTYALGKKGGVETVTLSIHQMPAHTHTASFTQGTTLSIPVNVTEGDEDEKNPGAGVLANTGTDNYSSSANGIYNGGALQVTGTAVTNLNEGGSQSHTNIQPYLAIHYIIALQGTYPSRD